MIMDIEQPFVTQEQKFKYWEESKAEIKHLRAKVEVLVEYVKRISACYRIEDVQMYAREALATYDKLSGGSDDL